jgi:hypothetical protein
VRERSGDDERQIVGREAELAALRGFLGGHAIAFVLSGGPGIGKTTLWEGGIAAARAEGLRVLVTRASSAEAQLSFAALSDLLNDVDEELGLLPVPQRHALEVALLRAEPFGAPPEQRAIALGFLNSLRSLSEHGAVLVAIDDVQWLDPASAEVLVFAARRLERADVRFLIAKRPARSPAARARARAAGDRARRRRAAEPRGDSTPPLGAARPQPAPARAAQAGRRDARQPPVRARARPADGRARPARARRGLPDPGRPGGDPGSASRTVGSARAASAARRRAGRRAEVGSARGARRPRCGGRRLRRRGDRCRRRPRARLPSSAGRGREEARTPS